MTKAREQKLNNMINDRLERLSRIKRDVKNPDRSEQVYILKMEMEINAMIDKLVDEKEAG